MANKKEFQQCEANTKRGPRCRRKGIQGSPRFIAKKFFWFFTHMVMEYSYYCTQHSRK